MNTENNILLAEFLEFQKTDLGWFDSEGVLSEVEQDNCFDSLYFDTDWNWLMAVVLKIENTNLIKTSLHSYPCVYTSKTYLNKKHRCEISRDKMFTVFTEEDTKILATYKACVEFVKWYNKENNEK